MCVILRRRVRAKPSKYFHFGQFLPVLLTFPLTLRLSSLSSADTLHGGFNETLLFDNPAYLYTVTRPHPLLRRGLLSSYNNNSYLVFFSSAVNHSAILLLLRVVQISKIKSHILVKNCQFYNANIFNQDSTEVDI